jgi:hypothetical protein
MRFQLAARGVGVLVLASLLLGGCGEATPDSSGGGGPEKTKESPAAEHNALPGLEPPPSVVVRYFDESIELTPWTYCYGNGCADGMPPENPPDVGNPEEIIVEYPLPGWSFTASFRPSDDDCGRVQEVPLEPAGEGAFVLRPAGYAGTYDVTLFGRGDGDLFTTFRWTTTTDGPRPKPEARLAVLADHDGKVDSYGIELEVTHLARTPRRASAVVTVRADGGGKVTFKANRAARRCWPPEGTVYWDGPDKKGLDAAALGEGPFTYEVELMLDGVRYIATAQWPADEIAGNEPSVALNFTPNLPALP